MLSTKKYENTGSSGLPCHQVHLDLRGQELPHCRFLTLLPNNGGVKIKRRVQRENEKKNQDYDVMKIAAKQKLLRLETEPFTRVLPLGETI